MPAGIKSPIGSRTFSATSGQGQGLRTYEVPDESEGYEEEGTPQATTLPPQYSQPSQSEIEARMRAARQAKATGQTPISPQAKERIEFLAGIGRVTKDVPVADTVFTIRTLKAKENRAAVFAASQVSRVETLFEGRRQQLARAITKIDGVEIDIVLGTSDIEARLDFIEELDENVSNYLYEEYAALNDEAIKKYGLKTEAEVKATVEDVKKS